MKFELTHLDIDILTNAYAVTNFRPGYQFNAVRTFMVLSKSIAALLRKGETELANDLTNTRKHIVELAFNNCEIAMKLKNDTRKGMRIIIKTLDSGAQPLGIDVWEVADDFDMEALRKSAKQMLNITLSYRVIATPNPIGEVVNLDTKEDSFAKIRLNSSVIAASRLLTNTETSCDSKRNALGLVARRLDTDDLSVAAEKIAEHMAKVHDMSAEQVESLQGFVISCDTPAILNLLRGLNTPTYKPLTVEEMDKSETAFFPNPQTISTPRTTREIAERAATIIVNTETDNRGHITCVGEVMVSILNEPGTRYHQQVWNIACGMITRHIETTRTENGGTGDKFYKINEAVANVEREKLRNLIAPTPTPTPPDTYEKTLAEAVGIICNPKSTDINHVTAVCSVMNETMTEEGSHLYKSEIWNVACACIARQIVKTKKLIDNSNPVDNSLFFKIKDAIVKVQRTLLLSYIDDTVVPETFNAVVKDSTKTITNAESTYEQHLLAVAKVATELDGEDVSDNDENTDNWGRAAFYIANEIANHRAPLTDDDFDKLKNAIASANRLETLQILN